MAPAATGLAPRLRGSSNYAEEQLASYLQNLESNPLGWQAVHFHFSKLSPIHRRDSTIRIALVGLQDLAHANDGRTFVLFNFDVVILVKGPLVSVVNDAVENTRTLFQDDPLSRRPEEFSTWYDLSVGHSRLQSVVRKLTIEKSRQQNARGVAQTPFVEIEPLDPNRLFQLQNALTGIDLSAYLRRQPICAILPDRAPQPVFEEIYVRIADLQKPLMPNVNFAGNRWLFQHLTQSLDLRVLSILSRRPEAMIHGPISLNMNVDTLMSQSFLEFDSNLREDQQLQIVIELQPMDVFADIKAFQFGRDFLRNKGYRLCLDGLTPETLVLCDREKLGVDLLKMHWTPVVPSAGEVDGVDGYLDAVVRAGPERLIIAHCDDDTAVEYGTKLGLKLFQGRYIDQLVNPGAPVRN